MIIDGVQFYELLCDAELSDLFTISFVYTTTNEKL